jgi:NAD(P)-dependent dehydrogenase (short-subunit alcohol dehydrogenase family)
MVAQRSGSIVNTAWTFGLYGGLGFAAYCASKGGVVNLTRQTALEHGPYGIPAAIHRHRCGSRRGRR